MERAAAAQKRPPESPYVGVLLRLWASEQTDMDGLLAYTCLWITIDPSHNSQSRASVGRGVLGIVIRAPL